MAGAGHAAFFRSKDARSPFAARGLRGGSNAVIRNVSGARQRTVRGPGMLPRRGARGRSGSGSALRQPAARPAARRTGSRRMPDCRARPRADSTSARRRDGCASRALGRRGFGPGCVAGRSQTDGVEAHESQQRGKCDGHRGQVATPGLLPPAPVGVRHPEAGRAFRAPRPTANLATREGGTVSHVQQHPRQARSGA